MGLYQTGLWDCMIAAKCDCSSSKVTCQGIVPGADVTTLNMLNKLTTLRLALLVISKHVKHYTGRTCNAAHDWRCLTQKMQSDKVIRCPCQRAGIENCVTASQDGRHRFPEQGRSTAGLFSNYASTHGTDRRRKGRTVREADLS